MKERLDKLLSQNGYGSRKEVKELVRRDEVFVNGECVRSCEVKVDLSVDAVMVRGNALKAKEGTYIMLNKPKGVVTANKDERFGTVFDVLPERFKDLIPVGRLDKDTEGLLLFTDDGLLVHRLISPKYDIKKTYFVGLESEWQDSYPQLFESRITLSDGYTCLPAKCEKAEQACEERTEPTSYALLTIGEGKYHQVKRMFAAVGNHVVYLKRLRVGDVFLDESLKQGEWRELTNEEVMSLKKAVSLQ